MYNCKYLNFSRSVSELDLIARKVIATLEGLEEVDDEIVKQYTDPDSEKYKLMVDEICKQMKFNSLQYHRIDDLIESIGLDSCKLCTYCFNGLNEK